MATTASLKDRGGVREQRRPLGGARGPVRRKSFSTRQGLLIVSFLLPAAVFVAVFTYYPMLVGGQMAFRNYNLNNLSNTDWNAGENFGVIFADPMFGQTMLNSLLWVVGSIVPQLVLGFALALWMRRWFPFRGVYQAFIFFPWAISGFLIGILFRWMFNSEFGVINDLLTRAGLIDSAIPWLADPKLAMFAVIVANVWYGVTFFAIMILAALQSVPEDVYEAAALDGAGKVRTLFQVTIPYIRFTLMITILLRVIWIFNFPDIIFGMTGGGPANQTHIVVTWMIQFTQRGAYGYASALGILMLLVLMLFALFYLMSFRSKKETDA